MGKKRKKEYSWKLEQKAWETIEKNQMIHADDHILVGVSGGADSLCLLEILYQFCKEGKVSAHLSVLHVNHGLRKEAEKEEEFVRQFCEEREIPFLVSHVDVSRDANAKGIGIEEAGRMLRRKAFAQAEEELNHAQCCIALGHHREDSAETLLWNLSRGCSLAGLCGIRPVSYLEEEGDAFSSRKNQKTPIIHPLIDATREEIEAYLNEKKIPFCHDASNEDLHYTRNRLRNQIMPELEMWVNSNVKDHMAKTASSLQEAEEYLEMETKEAARHCVKETPSEEHKTRYLVSRLEQLPPYLEKRVLYFILSKAQNGKKDIASSHVDALLQMIKSRAGTAFLHLPHGILAVREYDELFFETKEEQEKGYEDEGIGKKEAKYPMRKEEYSVRVFPFSGNMNDVPCGLYTKWFDYDKITSPVLFRTRQIGDNLAIKKAQGKNALTKLNAAEPNTAKEKNELFYQEKKLTRVMIDEKVPKQIRDRMVLPFAGNDVLWFPGGRINAKYLVDHETKMILELGWQAGRGDNGKGDHVDSTG